MHKNVHAGLAKKTYKSISGIDDNVPRQGLLMYYKKVNGVFQSIVALSTESYQSVDTSVQSIFFLGATTLRTPSEALDLALDSAYLNVGTMVGSSAGIALYAANTATNTLRRASKALHEDLTIFDDDLAWVMNTDKGTLNTLVGPMHTTSYVGPLVDANGDPAPHNYVPNSHGVGASVGVLPTGWRQLNPESLLSIVGVGDGYIDVRVFGTATTAHALYFQPVQVASIVGQIWTASLKVEVISGNPSSSYLFLRERTGLEGTQNIIVDGEQTITRTLSGASNTGVELYLFINNGVHDFTVRISQPQLSKSATKLTYVPTYGTAVFSPAVHRTTTTGKWLNAIPNSHGVGGDVGVIPTGWTKFDGNGITITVASVGDGWADFRVSGTATVLTYPGVYLCPATIPGLVGTAFTFSADVDVVFNVQNAPTKSQFKILEYTSASAYLVNGFSEADVGTTGVYTRVLISPTCGLIRTAIVLSIPNGQTVDYTIRISNPQLTDSGSKLPYTKTIGMAVEGSYTALGSVSDNNMTINAINLIASTPDMYIPGTANNEKYKSFISITHTLGQRYHLSCKVKPVGAYKWAVLAFGPAAFLDSDRLALFNLTGTGAIGTKGATVIADIIGPDTEGYYLCSISQVADATALAPAVIEIIPADSSFTFVGDGTSGALVKQVMRTQSGYQYPYIAPGTSSNVRTPDVINKGVLTSGSWTQMLQNSIFSGAASGTPGTAPTGWTWAVSGGTSIVSGTSLRLSAATGQRMIAQQTISVLASTKYYYSVNINVFQLLILQQLVWAIGGPSGSTITAELDGVSVASDVPVSIGIHKLTLVMSVSTTPGSFTLRFGPGCGGALPSAGDAEYNRPQLTASYQYPYAASGPGQTFTVPTTSASTGGNGCNIPMTPGQYEWVTDGVELAVDNTFATDSWTKTVIGTGALPVWNAGIYTLNRVDGSNNGRISKSGSYILGEKYRVRVLGLLSGQSVQFRWSVTNNYLFTSTVTEWETVCDGIVPILIPISTGDNNVTSISIQRIGQTDGNELVASGGWGLTKAVENDLTFTFTTDGTTTPIAEKAFGAVVGQRYRLRYQVISNTTAPNSTLFYLSATGFGGVSTLINSAVGTYEVTTTATAADTLKIVGSITNTSGQITFKILSFKHVTNSVYVPSTGDIMLDCLRGKTDAIELCSNGDFVSSLAGWTTTGTWVWDTNGGAKHTAGTANALYRGLGAAVVVGDRVLAKMIVTNRTVGSVIFQCGQTGGTTRSSNGVFFDEEVFDIDALVRIYPSSDFDGTVKVSIQKLLPSVFTAAALLYTGVASSELPVLSGYGILAQNATSDSLLYINNFTGPVLRYPRTHDGTTPTGQVLASFNRDEIHLAVVQTNNTGTQYRTGIRRYTMTMVPISAWAWDSWTVYDGSFNPLTHLRLALNGTIPLWIRGAFLSKKSLTEAELNTRFVHIAK